MNEAPTVYAFDAYGTLFDVHSAAGRMKADIGPEADRLSAIWRDKQLQYTWVRSMTGRMKPFHEVTADALDFAIATVGGISPAIRQRLLDAYMCLDAYPEVRDVLTRLKVNGRRLAILSNGSPGMLDAAVASSGLEGVFDAVLSIESAGIYKPDPSVYALVTDNFSCAPASVAFQSSNRWDIAGAAAFGFCTTWINRFAQPDEFPDMPAGRTISSLEALLS